MPSQIKFTLYLPDCDKYVSSPTDRLTSSPNLAGVFTANDLTEAKEIRLQASEMFGEPVEMLDFNTDMVISNT